MCKRRSNAKRKGQTPPLARRGEIPHEKKAGTENFEQVVGREKRGDLWDATSPEVRSGKEKEIPAFSRKFVG